MTRENTTPAAALKGLARERETKVAATRKAWEQHDRMAASVRPPTLAAVQRLLDARGRMLAERIAPELARLDDPALVADILRREIAALVFHLDLAFSPAAPHRLETIRPR